MTLPRACRSLISPVVTETERQKKAKELPAQSSPSPLLSSPPLCSSCFLPMLGWPWSEQLQAAVCTASSNPSIPPGGRGAGGWWERWWRCVGGVEEDTLHCWSFAKGCRKRERERESTLVLFCNERMQRGLRLKDVCGSGLRICIHKQRMVLRILLSACSLSPRLRPAVVFCLLFC